MKERGGGETAIAKTIFIPSVFTLIALLGMYKSFNYNHCVHGTVSEHLHLI